MEGSGGTEGAACEVIYDIPPSRDCKRHTWEVFALLYPDEALAEGKGGEEDVRGLYRSTRVTPANLKRLVLPGCSSRTGEAWMN